MSCEMCEANRLRAEAAERDYALLDKDHRKARQTENLLKAQLADKHRTAPNSKQVLEVQEHWASELGHPRVRVTTNGKRAESVRKALETWNVAELKQAVDGLAAFPYVWNGRRRRFGWKAQRFDRLETCMGDVDRFRELAVEDEPDERTVMVPARVLDDFHRRLLHAREFIAAYREMQVADQQLIADLAARLDEEHARPQLRVVS